MFCAEAWTCIPNVEHKNDKHRVCLNGIATPARAHCRYNLIITSNKHYLLVWFPPALSNANGFLSFVIRFDTIWMSVCVCVCVCVLSRSEWTPNENGIILGKRGNNLSNWKRAEITYMCFIDMNQLHWRYSMLFHLKLVIRWFFCMFRHVFRMCVRWFLLFANFINTERGNWKGAY